MNNRLKSLRKKIGLTQTEFAEKLGISQTFLSSIELGVRGFPTEIFLRLIELNVNIEWLFTGKGQMFKAKPDSDPDLLNKIESIVKNLPLKRQKMVLNYVEDQRDISALLNEQDNPEITPK